MDELCRAERRMCAHRAEVVVREPLQLVVDQGQERIGLAGIGIVTEHGLIVGGGDPVSNKLGAHVPLASADRSRTR